MSKHFSRNDIKKFIIFHLLLIYTWKDFLEKQKIVEPETYLII